MEEIKFVEGIYRKIISRVIKRNFEVSLDYYERDLRYESGNESDIEITNELDNNVNDSESKSDKGIDFFQFIMHVFSPDLYKRSLINIEK